MHGGTITSLVIVAVFVALWAWAGYAVGKRRGRPALGAVLSALLGLIGLGILMLIPRTPEAKARHERVKQAKQAAEREPDREDYII